MKKITLIFAAMVLALSLVGCAKKDSRLQIGIIQLVEHDALDANRQGFIDGLAAAGYVDGENIVIDFQNAQGEQANCSTIADKFVSDRKDLIFAIATPAAQAVAGKTSSIPIVISSVTDPVSAELADSNEHPGHNVTGTSDLNPCAAQIDLLKQILPETRTVGILFCSAEENSRFQVELAEKQCDKIGLSYLEFTVSNTNEVQQVVQSMAGKVDAIYAPTDNMIANAMATVAMVATENGLPIICGEDALVKNGGLATYGLNYYELGKQTAAMAVDILKNGSDPAEMPIQYLSKYDFSYNESVAEALGITIPSYLLK
ncbi:MAG: ABC transporter substrate-binding protein [Treponema sp.]|nr:ABC transporter substrate-binding protein [Treponema sp.]